LEIKSQEAGGVTHEHDKDDDDDNVGIDDSIKLYLSYKIIN